MSARSSNRWNSDRPRSTPRSFRVFAIVGAVVALVPCLGSGCGGSPAAGPGADAGADVTILPLAHVMTSGGGVNGASSSGAIVNPFGPVPDGAAPNDSGSSSGSSSGGSDATSSSSGGTEDSGDDAAFCAGYAPLPCAGAPCDLRTHTCCITVVLGERCVDNAAGKCNSNEAAVHCSQACDCPNGQSCCGTIDTLLGSVQSQCTALNPSVNGGQCEPNNVSQVSGQLCTTDAECQNGQPCIFQTCIYGAMLHICGLQSQQPFACTANASDQ